MYQRFCNILFLALICSFYISGCNIIQPGDKEGFDGRLLIWHPFEGKEAEAIKIILDKYRELYPKIQIISEFFPEDKISEQFRQKSQAGLGPDLMISSYQDLIPLIRVGVLKTLNDYNLDLSSYLPRPIGQVTYKDKLYGLPFSLNTQVLCYNKTKVERPLNTLPEMMAEIDAKRQIAQTSSFLDTFWGVQVFQHPTPTRNKKEIERIVDFPAWANWLEWLRLVKKNPNFILADESASLDQVFAEGKLAYYICKSEDISNLQATLGEDKFGITTLPSAGNRSAGPLLFTKAIVFNRISSQSTTKLALQLARFLTNAEQQTILALETQSLIPVNKKVQLDRRLSPIQAVLFAQSKTAVAVDLDFIYEYEGADKIYGDLYYNLVMSGEMMPQEAASEFTQKILDFEQNSPSRENLLKKAWVDLPQKVRLMTQRLSR
ncbi:MAG: extracellular solute-binding protein [Waterburya sp.]